MGSKRVVYKIKKLSGDRWRDEKPRWNIVGFLNNRVIDSFPGLWNKKSASRIRDELNRGENLHVVEKEGSSPFSYQDRFSSVVLVKRIKRKNSVDYSIVHLGNCMSYCPKYYWVDAIKKSNFGIMTTSLIRRKAYE